MTLVALPRVVRIVGLIAIVGSLAIVGVEAIVGLPRVVRIYSSCRDKGRPTAAGSPALSTSCDPRRLYYENDVKLTRVYASSILSRTSCVNVHFHWTTFALKVET